LENWNIGLAALARINLKFCKENLKKNIDSINGYSV